MQMCKEIEIFDFNLKAFQKKCGTEENQMLNESMKLLFYNKLKLNPSKSPETKQDPVQDTRCDNEHKS